MGHIKRDDAAALSAIHFVDLFFMPMPAPRIGLLSDFNVQNLSGLLRKCVGPEGLECFLAPYGQSARILRDPADEFWTHALDAVVIWTLPEVAIPSLNGAIYFEGGLDDAVLAEVDLFAALIDRIPERVRSIIVPTWIVPGMGRGLGPLDFKEGLGLGNMLSRMNLRLATQLKHNSRTFLFDTQNWLIQGGPTPYSPKLWYLSKTPFQNAVFLEASKDIMALIETLRGVRKKVIILDLDNTLWGGVVGDIGWERLRLGGHDPLGESFVDFQKALKRLQKRGILLAIASKNDETLALEAISQHPEMVLKKEDFVAWKINWKDKAANVAEILRDLNLGLDATVFFDDNPAERHRVKEALPAVTVPDLPFDPMECPYFLDALRCFDSVTITEEDRNRSSMYISDQKRTALRSEMISLQEWFDALEMRVVVERLNEANLERSAQLLNKTNQMNLSTRRMTSSEFFGWAKMEGHYVWTFRVADRFGDHGLCGIGSLKQDGTKGRVIDFVLSCRVLGRGVEEAMFITATRQAKALGCEELRMEFIPTAKNHACKDWLAKQQFLLKEGELFRLTSLDGMEYPGHVRIELVKA